MCVISLIVMTCPYPNFGFDVCMSTCFHCIRLGARMSEGWEIQIRKQTEKCANHCASYELNKQCLMLVCRLENI